MSRKIYRHLISIGLVKPRIEYYNKVAEKDKVLSLAEYWSLSARGRNKYQRFCIENQLSYPPNNTNPKNK